MSKPQVLKISKASAETVEQFRRSLFVEANDLFSNHIPMKMVQLDAFLKEDVLNITDMTSLHAPLDIPIPEPPNPEDEAMESDDDDDDEEDDDDGGKKKKKKKKKKAPKCGFIKGNEKIAVLLDRLKPEIMSLKETIVTVSCWIQMLIPKVEDGNDFGVAIQEKILERLTAVRTKVDTYRTNINKYFSERGDTVGKASKETHVMDYRSLVHDKDEAMYSEIRVTLMDIRSFYAELYDIISKNEEKVTNPKGEEKSSMY